MKRYSLKELKPMLEDIIYDYIANGTELYFKDKVTESGDSVPALKFAKIDQLRKDIEYRISDLERRKLNSSDEHEKDIYSQAIEVLVREKRRVTDVCITHQKELYEETRDVFVSHTFLSIPLNKKINAYYDDFNISVCYFDDLSNSKAIKEFNKLKTSEERIAFVKSHIEITHIALTLSSSNNASIAIQGKFKPNYTDPTSAQCEILPTKYADFGSISLAECEEIANNDLKQIIQERIDMDKENLDLLAEMVIKGDLYKLFKSNGNIYIRYVCPSTQRVYYNAIDVNYLSESQYFNKHDFNSYLLSWFSINNLFMELDEEEIKIPTNRC